MEDEAVGVIQVPRLPGEALGLGFRVLELRFWGLGLGFRV